MIQEMLFDPRAWILVGLGFLLVELISELVVALSLGLAAFVIGVLLWLWPNAFPNWYVLLFVYAVLSLTITVIGVRMIRHHSAKHVDIND